MASGPDVVTTGERVADSGKCEVLTIDAAMAGPFTPTAGCSTAPSTS